MRCHHARRLMVNKASHGLDPREEGALSEHFDTCPACSGLGEDVQQTWDLLLMHPTVEPSPEFLPSLKARMQAEMAVSVRRWNWWPRAGWQWATAAACLLLAAVLVIRMGPWQPGRGLPDAAEQGTGVFAGADLTDEQFLQELDQELRSSSIDYLSVYDAWPASPLEEFELPPAKADRADTPKKKEVL